MRITTLAETAAAPVDMMSVVIIGSTTTRIVDGRMVTPRGYPLPEVEGEGKEAP